MNKYVNRSILLGFAVLALGAFQVVQHDSMANPESYVLLDGHLSGQPELPYSVGHWDRERPTFLTKNSESIARILAAEYPSWTAKEVRELSNFILQLSQRHQFSPALILSVIDVESRFNPLAISDKGAMGLMQIKPSTAEYIATKLRLPFGGSDSLYDPKVNLSLSVQYMRELRDQFPDPQAYLAAYNWGPGIVTKCIQNKEPIPSQYYNKVMRSYHKYRSAVFHAAQI